MKNKKLLMVMFAFVAMFLYLPHTKASMGELIYFVETLADDRANSELTLTGWAHIHKFHNNTPNIKIEAISKDTGQVVGEFKVVNLQSDFYKYYEQKDVGSDDEDGLPDMYQYKNTRFRATLDYSEITEPIKFKISIGSKSKNMVIYEPLLKNTIFEWEKRWTNPATDARVIVTEGRVRKNIIGGPQTAGAKVQEWQVWKNEGKFKVSDIRIKSESNEEPVLLELEYSTTSEQENSKIAYPGKYCKFIDNRNLEKEEMQTVKPGTGCKGWIYSLWIQMEDNGGTIFIPGESCESCVAKCVKETGKNEEQCKIQDCSHLCEVTGLCDLQTEVVSKDCDSGQVIDLEDPINWEQCIWNNAYYAETSNVIDLSPGNPYCSVYCREKLHADLPLPNPGIVNAGRAFTFQPMKWQGTRECGVKIARGQWASDWTSVNKDMESEWKEWQLYAAKIAGKWETYSGTKPCPDTTTGYQKRGCNPVTDGDCTCIPGDEGCEVVSIPGSKDVTISGEKVDYIFNGTPQTDGGEPSCDKPYTEVVLKPNDGSRYAQLLKQKQQLKDWYNECLNWRVEYTLDPTMNLIFEEPTYGDMFNGMTLDNQNPNGSSNPLSATYCDTARIVSGGSCAPALPKDFDEAVCTGTHTDCETAADWTIYTISQWSLEVYKTFNDTASYEIPPGAYEMISGEYHLGTAFDPPFKWGTVASQLPTDHYSLSGMYDVGLNYSKVGHIGNTGGHFDYIFEEKFGSAPYEYACHYCINNVMFPQPDAGYSVPECNSVPPTPNLCPDGSPLPPSGNIADCPGGDEDRIPDEIPDLCPDGSVPVNGQCPGNPNLCPDGSPLPPSGNIADCPKLPTCGEGCDPNYPKFGSTGYVFRVISLNDVFPELNVIGTDRVIGSNWLDAAGNEITLVREIEAKGYDIYRSENELEYEITLTPGIIKDIRNYNRKQAEEEFLGYTDFETLRYVSATQIYSTFIDDLISTTGQNIRRGVNS